MTCRDLKSEREKTTRKEGNPAEKKAVQPRPLRGPLLISTGSGDERERIKLTGEKPRAGGEKIGQEQEGALSRPSKDITVYPGQKKRKKAKKGRGRKTVRIWSEKRRLLRGEGGRGGGFIIGTLHTPRLRPCRCIASGKGRRTFREEKKKQPQRGGEILGWSRPCIGDGTTALCRSGRGEPRDGKEGRVPKKVLQKKKKGVRGGNRCRKD